MSILTPCSGESGSYQVPSPNSHSTTRHTKGGFQAGPLVRISKLLLGLFRAAQIALCDHRDRIDLRCVADLLAFGIGRAAGEDEQRPLVRVR